MRFLMFVAALLLLAPSVAAHGAFHGDEIPRLTTIPTAVRSGNNTAVHVLYEQGEVPAGLFLFSGQNRGEGHLQASLVHDLGDGRTAVRALWDFAPGQGVQVEGAMIDVPGNYTIVMETTHPEWVSFVFYFDHVCSHCVTKRMPPELEGGAIVFPWTAESAGTYRVDLQESAAHHLDVSVVRQRPGLSTWPVGFDVLASSEADVDGHRDAAFTHRLEWEAEAGETSYVVAQAVAVLPPGERPLPSDVFDPWRVVPTFSGPLEKTTPLPAWLPLAGILAAFALVRRFNRSL